MYHCYCYLRAVIRWCIIIEDGEFYSSQLRQYLGARFHSGVVKVTRHINPFHGVFVAVAEKAGQENRGFDLQ